jgi:tetratricopeptide (TPR) repeat protein
MTIESLVHDAALWLENERRMELGLAGVLDKFVLVPAEQRAGLAKRLGLTDQVAARLAVLDGDKRVREILGQAFGSELEPVITALSLLGLGVFSSDKQALSAAKAPPAAPPSDPRYQRAPPPPAFDRRRTSEMLRQIGSVARALHTNDADIFREPSSEHEGRLLAEQAFQRGRAHFDASRFPQASSAFRRAVQLAPTNAEYALFALWCDSRDKLADAGAALQLRRAAANAVRSDPNCAFGCYVLGRLAFAANDFDKAGRFFRRASVLDPAMTDAERYLRVAGSRIKPSR